jgi:prenyltransferase beta subunit
MNRAWLADLKRKQNADGTFGTGADLGRDTGSTVAAILRLGGKVERPDDVLRALNKAQRGDGGFGKADAAGSDLETTYRVVRTYTMLGSLPIRRGDCRDFVARCRNLDGGYGVAPGQPSSASGTYFASIVLHWLAGKK